MKGCRCLQAVTAAAILAQAAPARAHLASTDLGPFYDGLLHALVSPEDLLIIVALAILSAQTGRTSGRALVVALALAWTAGTFTGYAVASGPLDLPLAAAVVILALGVLGMFAQRLPVPVLTASASLLGIARGYMNGAGARAVDGPWLSVIGIATGVFAICVLAAGLGSWLAQRRLSIALRVAGSWIAAIGLLMAGWQLRG